MARAFRLYIGLCFLMGQLSFFQTSAQAQPAETTEFNLPSLHLYAQELEASGTPLILSLQGDGRLFWGELRLLAQDILWAPDPGLIQARGQIHLAAPEWELSAEQLELRPNQGYLQAQNLQLNYRGLVLKASRAEMTGSVWQFYQVEVSLSESPLVLQAARLRILPGVSHENLMLEEVGLPQVPLRLPVLTLSLPEISPRTAEVRAPVSAFQPEVGLTAGGLRLGLSSQLWNDEQQRLYGRLAYDPLLGPLAEFSHEWRPQPSWLLHSQLGISQQGLQARAEALWQTPVNLWLRGRARLQQPDSFLSEFWLPPLNPIITPVSGLELWTASEWLSWGPLRTRVLAGARTPQQQAGITGLGQLTLYADDHQRLEGSVLLNGLLSAFTPSAGTAGARLLYQHRLSDNLTLGTYLEQYVSGLPSGSFLQPERLNPWLAAYTLWQPREDLGFGLEAALSLTTGRLALADALISWRIRPFYLHLLLQGVPIGVQLQTRFEL